MAADDVTLTLDRHLFFPSFADQIFTVISLERERELERERRESERGKGRMREKGEKERKREITCAIDNVSTWYEIGRKSFKQMADIPLFVE